MSKDAKRTGGVDGVTAKYTDMRRSGELLMGISSTFLTDAATIGGYAFNPDVLSSAVFAPAEAAHVEADLAGVGTRLAADGVELGVLGTFLVGAVDAYELADQTMSTIETGVAGVVDYSIGLAAPGILLVGGWDFLEVGAITWGVEHVRGLFDSDYHPQGFGDILGDQGGDMFAWLEQHPQVVDLLTRGSPGLVNGLTHGLPGAGPLTYEQTIALILGLGSVGGYFDDGSITVQRVDGNPAAPPARDLESVFDQLGEIDKYGGKDYSRIRVVQSEGDDGVKRWIVEIPSTKSWDPSAGPALNDVTACLEEMGGRSSQLEAAVRDAMNQAGVQKGDPVMLTGFSLGGITAGHLASDSSFTSDYNVQAVLTAGSPVARFDIGNDVQVLSIEHYDDIVPHLDGYDNPDRANWTTVTDTTPQIPVSGFKPDDPQYLSSHNAYTYAQTAAEAQSSGDRSVDYYMNTVDPFLNGHQTATDFRAERVH